MSYLKENDVFCTVSDQCSSRWPLSIQCLIQWLKTPPMAEGLELEDFSVPFQATPFYDHAWSTSWWGFWVRKMGEKGQKCLSAWGCAEELPSSKEMLGAVWTPRELYQGYKRAFNFCKTLSLVILPHSGVQHLLISAQEPYGSGRENGSLLLR